MKKYKKLFLYFSIAFITLLTFNVSALENTNNNNSSSTSATSKTSRALTMPSLPTANEVTVTAAGTKQVNTSSEFMSAYKDININKIVLGTDLTLSKSQLDTVGGIYTTSPAYELDRSLMIDGNNKNLTFENGAYSVFIVKSNNITLHFKNISIYGNSAVTASLFGTHASSGYLDVIFENTNIDFSFGGMMQESNASTKLNLFFRKNNNINFYSAGFRLTQSGQPADTVGNDEMVFEKNSVTSLKMGGTSNWNKYFDVGSELKHEYGSINNYIRNEQVYLFENSKYEIIQNNSLGKQPALWSPYSQNTSNCSLVEGQVIINSADITSKPAPISDTPTSTYNGHVCIQVGENGSLVSKGLSPIKFNSSSSKIVLTNPKYFDIENIKNGEIFTGSTSSSSKKLQIYNSNISLYSSVTGEKASNSPYLDSTLVTTGNTGIDTVTSNAIKSDFTSLSEIDRVEYEKGLVLINVKFIGKDGNLINEQEVVENSTITQIPNAVVTGWTFAGWEIQGVPGVLIQNNNISIIPVGILLAQTENETELVFIANYQATITYKNISGNQISSEVVSEGSKPTNVPTAPTVEGKRFVGWKVDGAGDVLSSNDIKAAVVTGHKNYVAYYEDDTYTVTYKDHDGTDLGNENVISGAKPTNVPVPVRGGFEFVGWNDGTTTHANLTEYVVNSNVTFTAEYVETTKPPTIEVPAFTVINKGNPGNPGFDIMDDVVVRDLKDTQEQLLENIETVSTPKVDVNTVGFYTINYTVTDTDGNTANDTRVLLVKDENYVVDETNGLIIYAKDFEIMASEVVVNDEAVKIEAEVKVYNLSGVEVNNTVIVDKGEYQAKAGDYPIKFSVENGPERTINAKVLGGNPPILTVPAFTEVQRKEDGTGFNIMAGVSTSDVEDDASTTDNKEVTVVANPAEFSTATAGFYTIEYTATDSDNNVVEGRQVVLVNDGDYKVGDSLIIHANNFTKRVSEVVGKTSVADIKENLELRVYNKNGVDVTTTEPISLTDVNNYRPEVRVYLFVMATENDTSLSVDKRGTVTAGKKPTIAVEPFTKVNINDELFTLETGVDVSDEEDDIDNIDLTLTTDGAFDIATAGFYTVEYTVTDSDGNNAQATRVILVDDGSYIIDPEENLIIYATDFRIKVRDVVVEDINGIKLASGVKVYDKTGADVSTTNTITVDTGAYEKRAGEYDITYSVTNGPSITKLAIVDGGVGPTLDVPNFTEVRINTGFEILSGVGVSDDFDTDLMQRIDTGDVVVNTSVAGFYTIEYSVTDSDLNEANATRIVLVNDGSYVIDPEQDLIIQAHEFTKRVGEVKLDDVNIKKDALLAVYNKSGENITNTVDVTVDKGEYKAQVNIDGYDVSFSVVDGPSTTIKAKVVGGDGPELIVPAFKEIEKDSTGFDVMDGTSVTDTEDNENNIPITINATPDTLDTSVPGFKTIEYNVVDSDGNPATARQIVLVNDGTYVVDPERNLIIQANDFTKYISKVDTADAAIKTDATVMLFDKTGTPLNDENENAINVDAAGYTNVVGEYDVTFSVAEGPSITVKATVIAGVKPTLTVPAFTEISDSVDTFDVMVDVNATDPEDEEDGIALNVVVTSNDLQLGVPGIYKITYEVTDSDGNKETGLQVVVVNNEDKDYVVGDNYIIYAKDFEIRKSLVDTNDLDGQVKLESKLIVYEKATGNVNTTETVTITHGDPAYTNVVGTYGVEFAIGSDVTKAIEAKVIAGDLPTIEVDPKFVEVNTGVGYNVFAGVSGYDETDKELEVTADKEITAETPAGVYTITYTATDSDDNIANNTRVVIVNDGNYVIGDTYIIHAKDFEIRKSLVDTNDIDTQVSEKSGLVVYEKATGNVNTTETVTITHGDPTYTNVVGEYDVEYSIGSDVTKAIKATVISGEAPILTAPAFTEITVGGNFEIMQDVEVTDEEDDNVELLSDVTFNTAPEIDTNVASVYTITYFVTDSDGNTDSAVQVLLVNNEDTDYIVGDNYIIYANDFEIRKGLVDTNDLDGQVKDLSGLVVYEKATGNVNTTETVTLTHGDPAYTNIIGAYDVEFAVGSDVTKSIVATVITGNAPVLEVPAFTEINVDDDFDELLNTRVTDEEDDEDNLTIEIIATPQDLNTSVAGIYKVTYLVTDSDGNTDTGLQVVVVNNEDKDYVVGDNYIIYAKDFEIRKSLVDTNDLDGQVKLESKLIVYEKATGNVNTTETVTITHGDPAYTNVVGTYGVEFAIGSDVTKAIEAKVIAGDLPTIEVDPKFVEVNTGVGYNVFAGVSGYDETDKELEVTADKEITTETPAGVYTITYTATDSDDNIANNTRVVLVNDGNYVIGDTYIIHAKDFVIRKSLVDTNDIDTQVKEQSGLVVYEKETGNVNTTETVTITHGDPTYTNVVGEYDVEYSIGSDVTKAIVATVTEGEAPNLTAPAFTEISVDGDFNVMNDVEVSDAEDDDVELLSNVTFVATPEINTGKAGFYTIEYSVEDSDGNQATASQVLLVNDGTYVVDPERNIIINANDFTKYISEVNTEDAAIKEASTVKVYNKSGEEMPELTVMVDKGTYTNVAGKYDITFSILDMIDGPTITIEASVIAGEKPLLSVDAFTEINVGDVFEIMSTVAVEDEEDDNEYLLTQVISDPTTFDTNEAGFYTIEYSVEDSDGNKAIATRVVLVNDGTYIVDPENSNLIIQAKDFTRTESKVDASDEAVKEAAQVKVFNKTGAEVTDENVINVIDKGGYTNVAGEYQVTFAVEAGTSITIKATVTKGTEPILKVEQFTELKLNDYFDVKDGVKAEDEEDDNDQLTANIIANPDTVDTSVAGFTVIEYSVTDLDGNTVTATRVVLVNDGGYVIDPTSNLVIKAYDFTKKVSDVSMLDADILEAAGVKVYDKVSGLEINDATITIDKGTYGPVVGAHEITYTANTNAKNNSVSVTKLGNVITGELPVLNVPGFSEITINSMFDVMAQVSAIDAEDGDLTQAITASHKLNTSVAGFYVIEYSVKDLDQNIVKAKQVVLVNDGSYIVGDNYAIKANDFTKHITEVDLDHNAIKKDAKVEVYDLKTGQKANVALEIVELGGYKNVKGNYSITFRIANDAKAKKTVVANVYGEATSDQEIEVQDTDKTNTNDGINTDESSTVKVALPKTGDESIVYVMEFMVLSVMILVGRYSFKK